MSRRMKSLKIPIHRRVTVENDIQNNSNIKTTFGTSIKFGNYTGGEIRTKDRFGMITRHSMPSNFNRNKRDTDRLFDLGAFVIEVELRGDYRDLDLVMESMFLNSKYSQVSKDLHYELSHLPVKHRNGNTFSVKVVHEVFESDADETGILYLPDFDVTVDFNQYGIQRVKLDHPFEPSKLDHMTMAHVLEGPMSFNKDSAVSIIEAFDNTGERTYTDKYVLQAGRVTKVKVKYTNKPGGFTGVVVKYNQITGESGESSEYIDQFSFEEARIQLGLADTIEDAKYHGDSKMRLVREEAKHQAEMKEKDRAFDKAKRDTDEIMFELKSKHEKEIQLLKAEYEELKNKNAILAETRKETIEINRHASEMATVVTKSNLEQAKMENDKVKTVFSWVTSLVTIAMGIFGVWKLTKSA